MKTYKVAFENKRVGIAYIDALSASQAEAKARCLIENDFEEIILCDVNGGATWKITNIVEEK